MALAYDFVYWDVDGNGDLYPRATPADINYPTVDQTEFGVVFGYENQYTGTYVGGGARPDQPSVRIHNDQDGTGTATVSNGDDDATHRLFIFLRHGGVLELIEAGSRTGNGDIEFDKPEGEYIGYVIGDRDNILSLPSNPDGFWLTNDRQYLIRTAAAEAELQAIRLSQFGIQVEFQNGNTATPVTVWASMSGGSEELQLRDSIRTNIEALELHIPRQTGFPPERFAPGATVTVEDRIYEIDTVTGSNAILERSSSFYIVCGNYRWLSEE